MIKLRSVPALVLAIAVGACSSARSQSPPPSTPAPQNGQTAQGAQARDTSKATKPYNQVITAEAITRAGLFKTHRVGDKLYYEIPQSELGRDMLLVRFVARNAAGRGLAHRAAGNRVLRWERRDDRVLLRSPSFEEVADSLSPMYRNVEAAQYAPILASLKVEAWGADSAAVIDVTKLFTTADVEEIASVIVHGNPTLDRERSFIERVAAYPTNIEVEATQTYTIRAGGSGAAAGERPGSTSLVVHWSMVRLPEKPMMPRLTDSRLGFYSVQKTDYTAESHRATRRAYITRWRLECPAGQAPPCEPVKPITYYIDPATPKWLVPYIEQGIEDWQPAFEEAGFRKAIVAAHPPTPEEDPDWAPEDARHSVVIWHPSTTENAMGPHVHDPRSGEILEADIAMHHNVMKLFRDWYFIQVGPLDPRAQKLPLPDELMGRFVRYVVAHEVGHTIGLEHNQVGSANYPADSLRSVSFLRRMGHTPSIMDYSRFNYVAQPEDKIPVELLTPDVGPYDRFAIMWGYRPIPGARTPDEELRTLDEWARRQDREPWLRFDTPMLAREAADAASHDEAVGDADPISSTRLGIKNLERVVDMLIPATVRTGKDLSDLADLYNGTVKQWGTELMHVTILVGGVDSQEKHGSQPGVRFRPLPAEPQREAVRYLNQAAFRTPEFLLNTEILRRIEARGALERIGQQQSRLLSRLLDDRRAVRMIEYAALADRGASVYTLGEMLTDVRRGIWSELENGRVRIDAVRRNLQATYLDIADDKLNPKPSTGQTTRPDAEHATRINLLPDYTSLMRGELKELDNALARAIPRAADRVTQLHLEAARVRIGRIRDPK